jgi:hypothetical protein
MSTSHSQESRSDQAGKRRKRKDRDRSGAPEPKNIVSGAGQPLDLSVRRELEEQLGHDFGRVRLHTDRDAGALTRSPSARTSSSAKARTGPARSTDSASSPTSCCTRCRTRTVSARCGPAATWAR